MPWWSAPVGYPDLEYNLIEGKPNLNLPLSNGSVTLVEYEDGKLTVKGLEIAVTVRSVKAYRILVRLKG